MTDKERDSFELRALQRVAQSGARALDLDVVLDRCLEQSMNVARADAAAIYLRDARRGVAHRAVARNTDDKVAPMTIALAAIDRIVLQELVVYDISDSEAARLPLVRPAHALGFRRCYVLRFVVDERPVGFVTLLFHQLIELAESTRDTLLAMAGFEAVAIEAARVHRELYERARVANLLRDFGERVLDPDADVPRLILTTARAVSGADRALIASIIERAPGDSCCKVTHAIGDFKQQLGLEMSTTSAYVADSLAKPLVIENTAVLDPDSEVARYTSLNETRSFLAVTMRMRDRPVGQLVVGSSVPREFSDAEIEGMELFSTMAAAALERQRRQDAERAQHRHLAAVIEHLPIVVAVINKKGEVEHVNAAGRAFSERMGNVANNWHDGFNSIETYDRQGKRIPPDESVIMRAFAGESPEPSEITLVKGDVRVPVLTVAAPLTNLDGSVSSVVTAFQDVSQLRNLADAKDRFLSIASHELRSPITSLRATTSLLQMDPAALGDDARRTTLFGRIQRQIDRLATLVERLLDTARLNAGELPLDYADCELRALCEEAIELVRPSLREHTIVLDAPAPLNGRWDPARVEQVITNLLSNAVRYSPPSEIRVVVRLRNELACVDVIDHGVGIPADEQLNVFTPFYRGAQAAVQHKAGLGLGLHITHEIARRHGGRLRVRSELGIGSTFTVELPLSPK